MSQASVSIPLDEFKRLEAHHEDLNKRNAELIAELNTARSADPEGRVVGLNKLARALLQTLSFATANLSPRDIKRWPHDKLREIADYMHNLSDHSSHDDEHAKWLLTFADECEMWEKRRKETPEVEIPPPFPTEQHPLAQVIMGHAPTPTLESAPGAALPTISGATSAQVEVEAEPHA
jgi:hypothetical protein